MASYPSRPGRAARPADQSRAWEALLDQVLARPALTAGLAAGLLIVLAMPVLSFRSLVIPVTAVILNLLSVAAAYGVIVAVFRWLGWLPRISSATVPSVPIEQAKTPVLVRSKEIR